MKKLIAIMLAACLMLCMAACTPPVTETPSSDIPQQDSFDFTYNGVKIALNAPAQAIIDALGEPKSYSESASCAFEGLDKTYGYGSFYIQTYPIGDKDYVYSFWFVDDMVETDEGICIGSKLADVQTAFGTEGYNGSNAYQLTKGSGTLTIILEKDAVSSIQYVIIAE